MSWKKVADSKDLIILEKSLKRYKLKIEARKNKQAVWEIFKTKIDGESSNLLSEHTIKDYSQLKEVIKELKLNKINGKEKKESFPPKLKMEISLKRAFKEDFVEKWIFSVEEEKDNFAIIRFDKTIEVNLIIKEKYKLHEKKILNQIEDKLGLKDLGETINYNLFYYKEKKNLKRENRGEEPNYTYNVLDFGLENNDDFSI